MQHVVATRDGGVPAVVAGQVGGEESQAIAETPAERRPREPPAPSTGAHRGAHRIAALQKPDDAPAGNESRSAGHQHGLVISFPWRAASCRASGFEAARCRERPPPGNAVDGSRRKIAQRSANAPGLEPQPVEYRARHRAARPVGELIETSGRLEIAESPGEDRHHLARRHRQQRQAADHGGNARLRKQPVPASSAASIRSTRARGNRCCSIRANSGPNSTSVMSLSLTPRATSARVNAPVPGPSSSTCPSDGRISAVIRRASDPPEGATAATRADRRPTSGRNADGRNMHKQLSRRISVNPCAATPFRRHCHAMSALVYLAREPKSTGVYKKG